MIVAMRALFALLLLATFAQGLRRPRIFRTSAERLRAPPTPTYTYSTLWFNQTVDHYGFTTEAKFQQKYLYNDEWWDKQGGPIFFYAGNEGVIEAFAENSGFMWDIAPEFNALLVFAEHRYYGDSLPFGKNSTSKDPLKVGYLSSSQALADYADLITSLKASVPGAESSPVIVFGGSYGGMLAAWFRTKFPHIVAGAIAASAPIAQFSSPCDAFGRIVTSDFSAAAPNNSCSDAVRASWSALDRVSQQKNNTGVDWINKNFRLCPKSQLKAPSDVRTLKDYLTEIWTDLAMMDYPYPTTFLAPLPADPVTAACVGLAKPYDSDQKLLENVFTGLNVYFNYTGDSKCLDLGDEDDIGAGMWTYQSCTEMVMPFCYDGTNDMFEAQAWDMDQYTKDCQETWGVTPRPALANTLYGGRSLEAASNIVFTNGLLDPWSSGGVLKPVGGTAALIIPEGAHHLDLRAANPKDPVSVVDARKKERQFIEKWIKQWKTNRKKLNRTTTVMQGPI